MSIYIEKKEEPLCVDQTRAANLLSVSTRTITRWEKTGMIHGHRVGKKRMYPYGELKRLAFGEIKQWHH